MNNNLIAALLFLGIMAGANLGLGTMTAVKVNNLDTPKITEAQKLAIDCYELHSVWRSTVEDTAEDDAAWNAEIDRGCWP